MTRNELLLRKLGEEACEVSQRIDKILWFGMEEIQEGHNLNNQERLIEEINDVFGALEVLIENDVIPTPLSIEKIEDKKKKIYKWLEHSRKQGVWNE